MRIGLVSDSHGNLGDLERAVSQMGRVEAIFHMGDYVDDALQIFGHRCRYLRPRAIWMSIPRRGIFLSKPSLAAR